MIITLDFVKIYLWIVYLSILFWHIGAIVKWFGSKVFGVMLQGLSSIFIMAEGIISVPVIHWLIFNYWR